MDARRYRRFVRGFAMVPRLPWRDVATLLHAGAVLVLVEALIRWVRLPRLADLLGVPLDLDPAAGTTEVLAVTDLPPGPRRQLRCTLRIVDRWPLASGPCLRRSLVAGHMLRRYGPSIRLGLSGSGDEIGAHAWLELHGRPLETVTSYRMFEHSGASSR